MHTNSDKEMCLAIVTDAQSDHAEFDQVTSFGVLCGVTESFVEDYNLAINEIGFYTSGVDLYYCVQANMQELLVSVIDFARRYLQVEYMDEAQMDAASFNFSRRTLNLLGMFKSFLDHGKAALIRRYGASSPELASWERLQSEEYDASSAYRLFSNLRNYSQHVGMPPLHFSLSHAPDEDKVGVQLEFKAAELLSSYGSWSKDAKNDLRNGPQTIFLLEALQDWSVSFLRLASWIQNLRREAVLKSAEKIVSIRSEVGASDEGFLVLMPIPKSGEDDNLHISYRRIPEEKAQQVIDGTPSIDSDQSRSFGSA